jgi:hypothetical protein
MHFPKRSFCHLLWVTPGGHEPMMGASQQMVDGSWPTVDEIGVGLEAP